MRQKLQRFEANKWLNNLIEPGKAIYKTIKGQWNNLYFPNNQPITLEMGCGHGAYTVGLGKTFPERNFIGIDIKGDRLWKGAQEAQDGHLHNVAFLRIPITQLLDFFEENEISEIWITFPDPRPKNKDIKRRLTALRFLKLYEIILIDSGKVHLKTDSTLLFQYTLDLLQQQALQLLSYTTDLYGSSLIKDHLGIQTTYEKRFLAQGMQISYLCYANRCGTSYFPHPARSRLRY
ncbi:tRNA (guanosine(46)-N7)-methyltransferase TrmB [Candidatus Cardinium hertigii]|jgi:tRNA (guanine-N7-)-methyltransferase|uniref:tRNA (guanine-N(7)-)-methyltransferase n=1 Tax=Candidatus Cardinium hertigii TaxID=247481 RepID=A0A3N2QCQ4_9BACT|nr:tRNA (guanosine(46)-N7)-methyltransferase TrmB [Candidatus Cardinium hertigii]ROT47392.1 tRNA (guanosine(46)-N7)-methyltransferase TrmB [Candidatus Cardinium hertigii]